MSAQIRPLQTSHSDRPVFPPAAAAEVLRELRSLVLRGLSDRMGRMFNGADDLLFEMSEKAQNNEQQRVYFDTMRALRLGRASISEHYETCILESFAQEAPPQPGDADPGHLDLDNLSLLESDELEESLAISNMAGKAEGIYKNAMTELERRFEWLAHHSEVTIPAMAIAPVGFCNAFRSSIKLVDCEFSIKLVLYKLYERMVLGDLMPLYADILVLLDRMGVQSERKQPPRRAVAAPAAGAAVAEAPQAMPGAGVAPMGMGAGGGMAMPQQPLPQLDPQTLSLLQGFGMPQAPGLPGFQGAPGYGMPGMPGAMAAGGMGGIAGMGAAGGSYQGAVLGSGYADAMLASELMAAARGQSVEGLDPGHAWAMTQRAGLVGRMFNEIVADPNLPRGITSALEGLRFPVIKTALSDSTFFSDQQHPVRSLINDLASMAASTRAGGPDAMARFEELTQRVKQQFDLNAETVRPKAREAAPLEQGDIERFLDQQLAQGRERRQVIVDKVKKVVAQELELQTLTHQPLPETAEPLLRSGWGPLMAMRLLRNGHDSELWRAGMELLHRVLFALNPKLPNARSAAEREALRRDLGVALAEVGMPVERIDGLLQGLEHALDDVQQDAVTESAAAPPAPAAADLAPPESALHELLAKLPSTPEEPPAAPVVAPPLPEAPPMATPERLLEKLLQLGSWFRVYDRSNHDTRWLKLTAWHPQAHRASFAEFDGRNLLTLHTNDLYADLMMGRSEPIDIEPATMQLLKDLRDAQPPAAP